MGKYSFVPYTDTVPMVAVKLMQKKTSRAVAYMKEQSEIINDSWCDLPFDARIKIADLLLNLVYWQGNSLKDSRLKQMLDNCERDMIIDGRMINGAKGNSLDPEKVLKDVAAIRQFYVAQDRKSD